VRPFGHNRHGAKIGGIAPFWATICKTVPVRPMLSDNCPVCPVLSVTLVHCGQIVGRIKMKLGMQVGFGPGHIVLDGDPVLPLPQKGHSSPLVFGPYVLWSNGRPSQLLLSTCFDMAKVEHKYIQFSCKQSYLSWGKLQTAIIGSRSRARVAMTITALLHFNDCLQQLPSLVVR